MCLSKLNILYVEPFYSGSHKSWIDSYKLFSKHNIDVIELPGRKWKWRMHGGAITLADKYNKLSKTYNLIICSDMVNLPVFKSLCSKQLNGVKILIYFHENQLSYPWSPNDPDIKLKRDLHYHFINYSSSLISDHNFFNSTYHLKNYIDGINKYLKKMPDLKNESTIDKIYKKSSVLYLGCRLKNNLLERKNYDTPIILWNHRWEYDKNPELFFNTLIDLKNQGIKFKVIVLGEQYKDYPAIFDTAKVKLNDRILYFGYCESYEEYIKLINKANILPVTSHQDFFGVSIVEAVAYGNYPILPNRLSYPEIFNYSLRPELFYESEKDFKTNLINAIDSVGTIRQRVKDISTSIIKKYDWSIIAKKYDKVFNQYID